MIGCLLEIRKKRLISGEQRGPPDLSMRCPCSPSFSPLLPEAIKEKQCLKARAFIGLFMGSAKEQLIILRHHTSAIFAGCGTAIVCIHRFFLAHANELLRVSLRLGYLLGCPCLGLFCLYIL